MNLEFMRSLEQKVDAHRTIPLSPDSLTTLIALASGIKTFDPPRAITVAEEAVRLAQNLGDYEGEARAWAIRAYAECQLEEDEAAMRHARIALALAEASQDPITLGYAHLVIGGCLITQTQYGDALEAGLKGYHYLERGRDIPAQANIGYVMLVAYSRLGDRQQAEAYGFHTLELYRELNDPGGEILSLNNLAVHFGWMQEYETARRLGEEALVVLRRLRADNEPFHFSYIIGSFMHTLADIAIAQHDLSAAEDFLQEGLAFVHGYPSHHGTTDEPYLMVALGKLLYRRGSIPESRHALLTALHRARALRHRLLLAEIAHELVALYEQMGFYKRALRYFRYHHNIEKGRYYDQLVSKMRRLEVEYEVKVARREMDLLTEKNQQLEQAYIDLQAANAKIRELSIRDGLTRLYNRQYFEEWATAAFQQSQQSGQPFAVLLCDIDNFKRINDTWLHHIGDKVLQTVAAELEALCPAQGSAARYGGEEFVLAVPKYNAAQITTLAEQFRHRIEAYPWDKIHPNIRVTVSIGVMESTSITSLTQQLIQADLYLYLAKRQGKNRVVGDESFLMPLSEYDIHPAKTA
jgi:diguanylate cyclase (GGDEF)-like protein